MTALNASTSAPNALQQINNLTIVHGIPLFGVTILIFTWLIIYMRGRNTGVRESITAASFFTSIVGLALGYLQLIPDAVTMTMVGVAIISIITLTMRR